MILSIFSIFQINSIASEIKLIQIYEKELEEIKKENEILIVDSAQINSLNRGSKLIEPLGFVRIEDVYYIKLLGDVVVKR
jgi:hypothetical protein